MAGNTIGTNLRLLRQVANKTQAQLAEAAGLSLAGYRKIELGQAVPRTSTLRSLAKSLSVGVEELVRPVPRLERVRFRSQKKLKRREQVLAKVGQRLKDYESLEELMGVDRPKLEMKSGTRSRGLKRAVAAAQNMRESMELQAHEPIRDICGLLEAKGVKVLGFPLNSEGFFGLSVGNEDGGPAIVVNTWNRISIERQIFTAAHELGHLVLHLSDYDISEEKEDARHEKEANVFASHFLMPDPIFHKEWQETRGMPFLDRVLKVKRMFRVSYGTVIYRIAEQPSEAPQELWKLFYAQYRKRYRRRLTKKEEPAGIRDDPFRYAAPPVTSEPENLSRSDFLPERLHWLVREALENELITMDRAAEILGLPLTEMRQLTRAWVE